MIGFLVRGVGKRPMMSARTATKYMSILSEKSKDIVYTLMNTSAKVAEFSSKLTHLLRRKKHSEDIVLPAMRLVYFASSAKVTV